MTFNEKLQQLRKSRGITQEELAQALYVSRTAISKWESGRGYPSIDSLKQIAKFYGVTVDTLLSGDEILTIAQEDSKQAKIRICDMLFGFLDIGAAMLLFLPFFGQTADGAIEHTSLLFLSNVSSYLRCLSLVAVISLSAFGILLLTLQNCQRSFWLGIKYKLSILFGAAATVLFIAARQPYAAIFLFVFLTIKVLTLLKGK